MRSDFSTQKRHRKSGVVYYVQFWDPIRNCYGTAVSSGKTSKGAAATWAKGEIEAGRAAVRNRSLKFEEYASGFWKWDSQYVRTLRLQQDITRNHADQRDSLVKNHLIPYFKGKSLPKITWEDVEQWMIYLQDEKGLSKNSVKHCYYALRSMLDEARRSGLIGHNPCLDARKPKKRKKTSKGVLGYHEAKILLDEKQISKLYGPKRRGLLHYTINLIAAGTGMRMSEIQGLKVNAVDLKRKLAVIVGVWQRKYGWKEYPKNQGSERVVFLSERMVKYIKQVIPKGAAPGDFIFVDRIADKPVGHTAIDKHFREACEAAGINNRKERNITFHSWRHFFNSFLLNTGMNVKQVQENIGHQTLAMTMNYYHASEERIRQIQEEIDGKAESSGSD